MHTRSLLMVTGLLILMASCGKSAASVYMRKGKDYYARKNYQMAIRFFEKTLEVDSTLSEAKYYRALCYYGLGHQHHACEEMSVLVKSGYKEADSSLKNMGCYYFPEDTLAKGEEQ